MLSCLKLELNSNLWNKFPLNFTTVSFTNSEFRKLDPSKLKFYDYIYNITYKGYIKWVYFFRFASYRNLKWNWEDNRAQQSAHNKFSHSARPYPTSFAICYCLDFSINSYFRDKNRSLGNTKFTEMEVWDPHLLCIIGFMFIAFNSPNGFLFSFISNNPTGSD